MGQTKVLGIVSQKGGAGKSTLATHLSVEAAQDGRRVTLLDLDPQQSSTAWLERREADNVSGWPVGREELKKAVSELRSRPDGLIVLDTEPRAARAAKDAIDVADVILVPLNAAIFDLDAAEATATLLRDMNRGQDAAFVINSAPPKRVIGEPGVVREAREALSDYGLNVCPHYVTHRASFQHALNSGSAVAEFEPRGKAAGEIRDIWTWLKEKMK